MANVQARSTSRRTWHEIEGHLYIAPWLIGFFVFTFVPFIYSFYLGFTQWELIGAPKWVGLANYARLLTDTKFTQSLYNTVYFSFYSVPLSLIVSFLLALLLNQEVHGRALFRTMFYIPAITPAVASALVWLWILQPQYGLLNMGLDALGIQGPNWLGTTRWIKPAIIIMSVWGVGQSVIIFLAGLQSVPETLHEAAKVDGANALHRFWNVTIPMMTPTIFFNLVMGVIGAMQVFTPALVLTEGGPGNASLFIVLYLYLQGFRWLNLSYASVLAWVLFVIILILTLINLKLSDRWVYYEAEMAR